MEEIIWGVLGPETLQSARRTRTLELGAAVRMFNEIAVPGLGGAWFGKQIFLAVLGVAVSERIRARGGRADNIQVANAIEALGCWLAYTHNGRQRDDRLRGIDKLAGVDRPLLFSAFSRRGFYVTQPMRMGTVQALRSLGLVHSAGERFNAYSCSEIGVDFIEACCEGLRPRRLHPLDALFSWASENLDPDTSTMRRVISPVEPLPVPAREQLEELLTRGVGNDAARRRAALKWMDALGTGQDSGEEQPPQLTEQHWHDLQAGSLFFALQAQAYEMLEEVEIELAAQEGTSVPLKDILTVSVRDSVRELRAKAEQYISHKFADLENTGANRFAQECADPSDRHVLERLLLRDERVLRLREGAVLPGQAFDPNAQKVPANNPDEEAGEGAGRDQNIALPPAISYRVRNLYLLNLDIHGELDEWLKNRVSAERDDE